MKKSGFMSKIKDGDKENLILHKIKKLTEKRDRQLAMMTLKNNYKFTGQRNIKLISMDSLKCDYRKTLMKFIISQLHYFNMQI